MNKLSKTTKTMDDSKLYPVVQITYLEKVVDAVVANHYGVHTSPKTGSPAIMLTFNGDEANRVVIPLSIKNRTKDLSENEVEVGNFEIGSIIKFDKDGNITLTSKNNVTMNITGSATINASSLTVNCDTTINGNLTVSDDITCTNLTASSTVTALTVSATNISASGAIAGGSVSAAGLDFSTHVHSVSVPSTPFSGNTDVPS